MNQRTLLLRRHSVTPGSATHWRKPRGLGLVELLLSLAIVASLLTAVAVGTHASFHAYAVNQEYSLLTQKSRLTMHRILSDVRTSDTHAVDADPNSAANIQWRDLPAETPVVATSIAMFDPNETLHVYRWDAATKRLYADVRKSGSASIQSHVMLEGVEKFEVTHVPMKSVASARTGGKRDLLRRATILLTVTSAGAGDETGDGGGTQTMTLSSSVVPRRNVW
jgi:hypothetical protein